MVVLVTGSESAKALIITRSLGKKGVEVHNAGVTRESSVYSSSFSKKQFIYTDPYLDEISFIQDLKNILSNQEYELLIPSHSRETYVISKHIGHLSQLVKIPLVNYKLIKDANNKRVIIDIASNLGIPVPKTIQPNSTDDLETLDFNFPVVLKILDGSGNKGLEYAHSKSEMVKKFESIVQEFGLRKDNYPIIQEMVKGSGAGTSFLFYKGKPKFFFTHKRLREYPLTGGPSTLRIGIRNKLMESYSLKLLRKMKWNGVAMCEYIIHEETNLPYLIEVNPRFWGSVYQPIVSGVDFPYLLYCIFTGKKYEKPRRKIGIKTRFLVLDFLAMFSSVKISVNKISTILCFLRRNNTHYDIEDFRDFSATFNFYIQKLKSVVN